MYVIVDRGLVFYIDVFIWIRMNILFCGIYVYL